MAENYHESMARWLESRDWTAFFTVTFRNPVRYPRQAVNRVARFIPMMDSQARAFVAAEPHSKGDYHVHGLLSTPVPDVGYFEGVWSVLFERFGRSRVESVVRPGAVANYCAKYVTKRTSDWDLVGVEAGNWDPEWDQYARDVAVYNGLTGRI